MKKEQKTENFRAFAKLYGYVRFFHPSDEAAAMDWDKFAIHGMQYVEKANSNNELKSRLEELFKPIAPTVDIFSGSGEYKYDLSRIIPKDTSGLFPVAWQHRGLGVSRDYLYKSVRSNRIKHPVNTSGSVSRSIDAEKYKGGRIKLKATVLSFAGEDKNYGLLWLNTTNNTGAIEDQDKKDVRSNEMEEYVISCEVTQVSDKINFGYSLCGEGVALADRFFLEVNRGKEWEKIDFDNPDFESDKAGSAPAGWEHTEADYDFQVISFVHGTGKQCCKIESVYEKQLFDKFPEPGEYFVRAINSGLSCAVPLCLYSDRTGTIPHADKNLLKVLDESLNRITVVELSANNMYFNLACIAIIWNVLQHSYPYFDLYDLDWENTLGEYLSRAYECDSNDDLLKTIEELLALINDCHAMARNTNDRTLSNYPPFQTDFAEGKLVISRLYNQKTGLKEGDVITEIDGRTVEDLIRENEKRISAAIPGWKRAILLRVLLRKKGSLEMVLKVKRENEELEKTVELDHTFFDFVEKGDYREYRPEKIAELEEGLYYIDMERTVMKEIKEIIHDLACAKGVIFDMRGYPYFTSEVLNHLSDIPLKSAHWNVPQIIYPDRKDLAGYHTDGRWEIEPQAPKISGKVVFLTNGITMSAGESVMGIVEAYKLGTIVGETTAGTNGNVNMINLPGGYVVNYTGMKVLKHDGSQHHGVGITPDIPVFRTIKGISEKRDEFLEKAIEIIKGS